MRGSSRNSRATASQQASRGIWMIHILARIIISCSDLTTPTRAALPLFLIMISAAPERKREREERTMEPRPGSECVYVGEQRAGGALWY